MKIKKSCKDSDLKSLEKKQKGKISINFDEERHPSKVQFKKLPKEIPLKIISNEKKLMEQEKSGVSDLSSFSSASPVQKKEKKKIFKRLSGIFRKKKKSNEILPSDIPEESDEISVLENEIKQRLELVRQKQEEKRLKIEEEQKKIEEERQRLELEKKEKKKTIVSANGKLRSGMSEYGIKISEIMDEVLLNPCNYDSDKFCPKCKTKLKKEKVEMINEYFYMQKFKCKNKLCDFEKKLEIKI